MVDTAIPLKTARNLEAFMRMLDVRRPRVMPNIEVQVDDITVFIEVRETRVLLTVGKPVETVLVADALTALHAAWSPKERNGVVLRAFAIEPLILVSTTLDPFLEAAVYQKSYRVMRDLLCATVR